MKFKLILCLALVSSSGLVGCSTAKDEVSLSGSEEQIRASILKITPLGTPIKEVKTSIQIKIHPDSFNYFDHAVLPDVVKGDKAVAGQWPLGGEHHGKEFCCQIGSTGIPLLSAQDVDTDWVFDEKDRLADVFVVKFPDEP